MPFAPVPPKDEPRVISEWSIDTLYVHLSRIVADMDQRLLDTTDAKFRTVDVALKSVEQAASAALGASERATNKAEAAMEKRFDGVNEFRSAMGDQANRFITREEVQSRMLASDKETAGLVSRLDRMEAASLGKKDIENTHRDNTGLWIGIASALIAFLALAIGAVGLFIANYHKV